MMFQDYSWMRVVPSPYRIQFYVWKLEVDFYKQKINIYTTKLKPKQKDNHMVVWPYYNMFVVCIIFHVLLVYQLGLCVATHYQWWLIDFVKIKFHTNENIESHYM